MCSDQIPGIIIIVADVYAGGSQKDIASIIYEHM